MARNNKILIREGTSAPNAADFDVSEPAWDKNNGKLYVKNAAGTMVEIAGGGGGFTGGTLTSSLTLATGTTSVSPLTFQAGTNLTTPTAGAVEYDGKVIYSTPAARGVSPSMMVYRLNSNYAGSNATGAQSLFGVGVTLAESTVYAMEVFFILQKTAGTTSHTISHSFGGTATINNIAYGIVWTRADSALTASSMSQFNALHSFSTLTSTLVLTGNITTASETFIAKISGTVSINAGGTFFPRYSLSAAPGGAYSTLAGSHIAIWPIGAAGANTSVGPWA